MSEMDGRYSSAEQRVDDARSRLHSTRGVSRETAAYSEYADVDHQPSDARILNQLEFMSDQMGKTRALLGELEERLAPVLLPYFETANEVASPPRKMASDVSNLIDDRNGDLSDLQRRIVQITGRVQL